MNIFVKLLIAFWLVTLSLSANATIVSFNFTGTVDDVFTVNSAFNSTMSMHGRLSYETTTPDSNPASISGYFYKAIKSFSMTIGGYTYRLNPLDNIIHTYNNGIGADRISFSTYDLAGPPINSLYPVGIYMRFQDIDGSSFISDSLPSQPLSLSSFANNLWVIYFDGGSAIRSRGYVMGTITSITASTIPEPSTLAIFVLGLVFFSMQRKKTQGLFY